MGDPWLKKIDESYQEGRIVKGKVTQLASFGAIIGLENDMEGTLSKGQWGDCRTAPPEKIEDVLYVGQEVEVRVVRVDRSDRRIHLSIKWAEYTKEQLKKEEEVGFAKKIEEERMILDREIRPHRSSEDPIEVDSNWLYALLFFGGLAVIIIILGIIDGSIR